MKFYYNLLKNNLKLIVFTFLLFLGGIALGYIAFSVNPNGILEATKEAFKPLGELADEIQQASFLKQVLIVFQQNLFSVTFIMIMGVFWGLIPALTIWGNGTLVGILLANSQQENALKLFFLGILPHAIFEVPAVILAAAWGIKIGHRILNLSYSFLFRKPSRFSPSELKKIFNEAGFIWLIVCLLLLLSAFIEIGVTFNIVKGIIEK